MLELASVVHGYGEDDVLSGVSLTLAEGRIGCILGPSGCGKTTLLRCIAGFEAVRAGEIRMGSQLLDGPGGREPAERRRIGMVFQDYALLPHLSALDNVAFGLANRKSAAARQRARSFLDRVDLGALVARYPHELSGGQQQRVAIARALAPEPRLLLMDEPFSNLDMGMRQQLGQDIRDLLRQLGATALLAMHDHHDAFALADDAGVLRNGKLLQWDTAYRLYHRPADRYVANFVGSGAWLAGMVHGDGAVDTAAGRLHGRMKAELPQGTQVDLLLRPDDVVHDDASPLQAQVVRKHFKGPEFLYELRLADGTELLSSVPSHHDHPVGECIGIRFETEHMVVFPCETPAQDRPPQLK